MAGFAKRQAISIGVWLLMVVQWFVFGLGLGLGYWLSDVLYDLGLWPLGALLRIGLLFGFLGWLFMSLMLVVNFFVLIFVAAKPDTDYFD